jgi:hypothetical protein
VKQEILAACAWDKEKAIEKVAFSDHFGRVPDFVAGAKWKHDQLIHVIEALASEFDRLNDCVDAITNASIRHRDLCGDSNGSLWSDYCNCDADKSKAALFSAKKSRGIIKNLIESIKK